MKRKVLFLLAISACIGALGVSAFAHHGTAGAYDQSKRVTLHGTVTEFIWSNPHCGILFDVVDEKGMVTHWGAEETNPHALSVAGWSKDVLKPGDKITITGAPARSGAARIMDQQIVLSNGRVLKGVLAGIEGDGRIDPSKVEPR